VVRRSGTTVSAARWTIDQIERAQSKPDFQADYEKTQRRKASAKAGSEKRAETVLEWARTVPIHVAKIGHERLRSSAIASWGNRRRMMEEDEILQTEISDEMAQRLQVNYLRHRKTMYDDLLDKREGEVGVIEARRIIRRRVYEAITNAYPILKEECQRQLASREAEEQARSTPCGTDSGP